MNLRTICALSLVLAVGCNEVEERLSWSPDGTQAILRADDELYLLDASGNLSAVIASNVTDAAWLPDGRGLVLLRSLTVDKWKDAEDLLPPAEVDAVRTLAKSFLALGAQGVEQFELKRPELANAAILYLFDTQSNALHQALQTAKDPSKLEADLSNARTTTVWEISTASLDGKQLDVIERTLTGLEQPRPSPKGSAVAFLRGEALTVALLDGSTNVVVAERVKSFDWAPDGKTLLYAKRLNDKDIYDPRVSEIYRCSIVETNDALVAGETFGLAMSASAFAPRVRCLADGRVLFAGVSLQLPGQATGAGTARFYVIDPALGTNAVPVAIPSAAGTLPQDLGAFAPSPDGRRIAIVESGSDSVAVLDVASGALEVLSPKRGWKSRILPAWRGNNELYFAALPEASSTRPALLRWSPGSMPQVFSGAWTDEVLNSLLERPSK